jgi:hypothetical protein
MQHCNNYAFLHLYDMINITQLSFLVSREVTLFLYYSNMITAEMSNER